MALEGGKERKLEAIHLVLMNRYCKRIPVSRNHLRFTLYGVNDQLEYAEGIVTRCKTCTQLALCLYEEEDDNDYYSLQPRKKSGKTFFYQVSHSLLERIRFEFTDGSMEEICIPLVSQKICYDVCKDLHLSLTAPQTFPEEPFNGLDSKTIPLAYP